MSSFIVMGGDRRMLSTAEKLSARVLGFDRLSACDCVKDGEAFSYAVLPPQKSPDGINIYSPLSDIALPYKALEKILNRGGTVFTGYICDELKKVCDGNELRLVNYLEREELAVKNAVLTAEGALELIINETDFSVFDRKILITGFGRIAKIFAKYLTAMGAVVTVACRKAGDREWADIYGCKRADITIKADFLKAVFASEIIINTVPASVFGAEEINAFKKNALYIELASADGIRGEVPETVRVITARGLPGKTAPVTAGEIIADTILNVLSEERGI